MYINESNDTSCIIQLLLFYFWLKVLVNELYNINKNSNIIYNIMFYKL